MAEIRKIWDPDIYTVEFGSQTFKIEPLPSGRARNLLDLLRDVSLSELGAKVADMSVLNAVAYVLEQSLEMRYKVLNAVFPTMTIEDVDMESLPKMIWLLGLVIDVNGFGWAREIAKNWLDQLKTVSPFLLTNWISSAGLSTTSTPLSSSSAALTTTNPTTSSEP